MPHGGTSMDENYSPFEGGAGGCPAASIALESRRPAPLCPTRERDFSGDSSKSKKVMRFLFWVLSCF